MDRPEALYEKLGATLLHQLVNTFYDLVFAHPTLAPLFKTNKELIKEKQRLFLTQFLGGPSLYSDIYGHPKLRARHLPHAITEKDAEAWLSCMSSAISSLSIPEELKDKLFNRFISTALFMVNKSS